MASHFGATLKRTTSVGFRDLPNQVSLRHRPTAHSQRLPVGVGPSVQGEPGSDQTDNPTAEQRRLVRAIDSKSRGHLSFSGRQFRLVAGENLKKLPNRDRYEVVRREEAIRILDGIAK